MPSRVINELNFTNDLVELIKNNDIIFNTLPANVHVDIYKNIINIIHSHKIDKQIYFINLAGGFSLYFQLYSSSKTENLTIGSTSSFPYACRVKNTEVKIFAIKNVLDIGFIGNYDSTLLNEIFVTDLNYCKSILEVGFKNCNPIIHPVISLFNISQIDEKKQFKFYSEGITNSISNILSQIDDERLLISAAYDYHLLSELEQDNKHYGTSFTSYKEYAASTSTHKNILSPISTSHRYITEDVPFGLVPLVSLAELKRIEVSTMKSIVQMYNVINTINYFNNGYVFNPKILEGWC